LVLLRVFQEMPHKILARPARCFDMNESEVLPGHLGLEHIAIAQRGCVFWLSPGILSAQHHKQQLGAGQHVLLDWADKIRPVRNSATPPAVCPIRSREAPATVPKFNPDSESRIPSAGARTTGVVNACRRARRTRAAEVSASFCPLPTDSSSSISVNGLTRIELAARATATDTVAVGPRTVLAIGSPIPA